MLESESVINAFETLSYLRHIFSLSWAYLGHILGYLGAFWPYLGHILGVFWTYLEHILGVSRAYLIASPSASSGSFYAPFAHEHVYN